MPGSGLRSLLLALYVASQSEEPVSARSSHKHVLMWSPVEDIVASLSREPVLARIAGL